MMEDYMVNVVPVDIDWFRHFAPDFMLLELLESDLYVKYGYDMDSGEFIFEVH
jgi:hypothetical protein